MPMTSAALSFWLMLSSTLMFAGMALTIRLASAELHAFEIAFFRNLFGLFFALFLLRRGSGLRALRTNRFGLYFLRCLIGLGAMLTGFWSLVHLPLGQAIALSYATPLFVTIGAVLVLGEVVRLRRWSAVVIGFIGVLIIVRPWTTTMSPAVLIAVLSSALAASAAITIKFLSRSEPAEAIVIWMVLIMTPLSLLPALPYWAWPSAPVWGWLVLTGFLGTAGHILLTEAYKRGDVSALTPINFVQLPVVALLAWWLFDEGISRYTVVGASIIFASTIYIARREARLARRAVTDEPIAQESSTVHR